MYIFSYTDWKYEQMTIQQYLQPLIKINEAGWLSWMVVVVVVKGGGGGPI